MEFIRTTGISHNVVRRYLRSAEAPRYKRRAPRRSKLGPFKSYVGERSRAATPSRIPATALWIELRAPRLSGRQRRDTSITFWRNEGRTNSRSILREILLKARRHLPISSGFRR